MNKFFRSLCLIVIMAPSMILAKIPTDGLIVVPQDQSGLKARDIFVSILDSAQQKIDLAMYQLKDQGVIDALANASKRGVKVRVVTEQNPFQHDHNQDKNEQGGAKQLKKFGVQVKGIAPHFLQKHGDAQAHHKILLVDDKVAVVMSCNWDTPTLAATRDFGLIIKKPEDKFLFDALNNIFESDWQNKKADFKTPKLIAGPDGDQRQQFINLFAKAKKSIKIYQQSYNDEEIAKALEEAAGKGINVQLIMMPFPFGGTKDANAVFQERLVKAGGKVHLVKTRYIHAKVVIIDDKTAYIGSCNFYPHSLEINREVGVITQNQAAVAKLVSVFDGDWSLVKSAAKGLNTSKKPNNTTL